MVKRIHRKHKKVQVGKDQEKAQSEKEASIGRLNQCVCKESSSPDQDGHHAHILQKPQLLDSQVSSCCPWATS